MIVQVAEDSRLPEIRLHKEWYGVEMAICHTAFGDDVGGGNVVAATSPCGTWIFCVVGKNCVGGGDLWCDNCLFSTLLNNLSQLKFKGE